MNVYSTPLEQKLLQELSESKHFLQEVANTSPDIIYVLDIHEAKFTYINERVTYLLGHNPSSIYNLGHDFFLDIIHPDDYLKRIEHVRDCKDLKDGEVKEIDVRWKMKDNTWNWFCIKDSVYKRDKNGNVVQTIGVARDINERKKTRQELEEKVRFIQTIAETSPDIMLLYDLTGNKIKYITKDIFSTLGYAHDSMLNMGKREIYEMIHPDDWIKVDEYQQGFMSISDQAVKEVEYRIRKSDGEWVWFHSRGKVFKRDNSGNVIQYISIIRDITQQKKAVEALIEAEKLAAVGSFVRTIVHEVRNPLTNINLAVSGLDHELSTKYNDLPGAKTFLDIIARNSTNINGLVKKLLLSSKAQTDELTKLDLSLLVDEILNDIMDTVSLRGVNVEKWYCSGNLIMANSEKLKIALTNVMVNAIEAMEHSSGILKLTIIQKDNSILLSVTDNGCGMTKEQQQKMFDPFYSNKAAGLGVGLANVKRILQHHHASIEVNSKPGQGTTFNIYFKSVNN
jgi:PAS domain S-box-containing protein